MSKKIIVFSVLVLITVLSFLVLNFRGDNKIIYTDKKSNQIINTNALTMMYETEADSGEYQVSNDTAWPQDGYVFNETLSRCENGGVLSWNNENNRVVMQTNSSDKCYVYFDVYEPPTLAKYIVSQYTTDGENGLYLHDGIGTYGAQEAGDNSYRYSGANPNNYVCFGSTDSSCPAENLYRIIGAFDDDKDSNYQIKLIKSDYTTSAMLGTDGRDYYGAYDLDTSNYKGSMETSTIAAYRWNYDTSVSAFGSNNWTTSEFNAINLNTNYWNYLGTTWQNLIAETTWHLGGTASNYSTAKEFYDGERNNAGYGNNPTIYTDEIGLMYPSDYGYASSPDAWATDLADYDNSTIIENNWMYLGLNEWTITPNASNSAFVFYVSFNGRLTSSNANNGNSARPVFYLASTVEISSGTGTQIDPYRLSD